MPISIWKKEGSPEVLAKEFGKFLLAQNFVNPDTGVAERFVQFGQKDWSVVFALTPDKLVLAVRQFKQGCDKIITELPAGTADFKDETPAEVMQRELLEETGYRPGEMVHIDPPMWIASRSSPTRFHCFLAINCVKVASPKRHLSEDIELVTYTISEWINAIERRDIDEPSAIVATQLGLLRLGATWNIPNQLSL